eukprot:COSAG05_NODE_7113_length_854_cov_1.498013_1_plen_216_part_01
MSLEEVAAEHLSQGGMQPVPMECPKGAVIIRDIRIWHRGVTNESSWPRHQVALCYSAESVREATIVNSTALRNLYEHPRTPESALSCAGGFRPPLPQLRFCTSCSEAFASPSLHDVDRNVQLVNQVDGGLDSWGQPVASLEVSPRRHVSSGVDVEWSFIARASSNHFYAAAAEELESNPRASTAARRVKEAELPDWALTVFRRVQASADLGGAKL